MNNSPKASSQSQMYPWYVVAVLTLAVISSFIDRQILSLLVLPIRRDFQITDTQMSLLMGFSFALFYTIMGIPIGRLADKYNRRNIISIGILLWSIMTTLCGMAASYMQLFLARIGVGVGEAALSPPAYSMISDYFPKEKLGLALSVYAMGIYIGSGMAYLLGGIVISFTMKEPTMILPLIGEIYSWQFVFFVIGLPGVLISMLIYFTVKEPARKNLLDANTKNLQEVGERPSFGEVLQYIRANAKAFLGVSLGLTFMSTIAYGSGAWIPTFIQRVHGWSPAQTGIVYGIIVSIFSTAGVVVGGRVTDYYAHKHPGGRVRALRIAAIATILGGLLYPYMPNGTLTIIFLIPGCFFIAFPVGGSAAAIQEMMPNKMRAAATSIYLFLINLIGMTVGPTSIALMTDYVFQDDQMIGFSIASVGFVSLVLAFLCYHYSQKPYQKSLQYLEEYLEKQGR